MQNSVKFVSGGFESHFDMLCCFSVGGGREGWFYQQPLSKKQWILSLPLAYFQQELHSDFIFNGFM